MLLIDIIDQTKTTLGVKSQTATISTSYLKYFVRTPDVITDNKPQFVFDVSDIEYR